jgi:D-alanine-D-alanine ligase
VTRLRVGVIYGGRSSEHEVSLASAAAIFAHLDTTRYEAVPILIEPDGRWSIATRPPEAISAGAVIRDAAARAAERAGGREVHLVANPNDDTLVTIDRVQRDDPATGAIVAGQTLDVVFPVVHGPYGEDGTLQGLLELANVPYVGAGVLASAVGMDKAIAKVLFRAGGLPVTDYVVLTAAEWDTAPRAALDRVTEALDLPVFVKPANLGSSVGISKAVDQATLESAIRLARRFDRKIVVEAAVPVAREIECAVLGNDTPEASVLSEIIPSGEFYDYASKYFDDASTEVIPADLSPEVTADIRKMALQAFLAIDGSGMARVDFLVDGTSGAVYLNELNTIPGFTAISQYAKLWAASGLTYPALLDQLIALAIERHAAKQRLSTTL